jgi:hypothetical protein
VVQGLILALQERGITSFVAGEASSHFASDENWARAVIEVGHVKMVGSLTRKYGIDVMLVNLETAEREDYPWNFGMLPLPVLCRTHAYINIAKMKVHARVAIPGRLRSQFLFYLLLRSCIRSRDFLSHAIIPLVGIVCKVVDFLRN